MSDAKNCLKTLCLRCMRGGFMWSRVGWKHQIMWGGGRPRSSWVCPATHCFPSLEEVRAKKVSTVNKGAINLPWETCFNIRRLTRGLSCVGNLSAIHEFICVCLYFLNRLILVWNSIKSSFICVISAGDWISHHLFGACMPKTWNVELNSTLKASLWGEDCPIAYKETKTPSNHHRRYRLNTLAHAYVY